MTKDRLNVLSRSHPTEFIEYFVKWFPISIVIGLICGVTMALFILTVHGMNYLFDSVFNIPSYLAMILGGIVSGIFIYFGRKEVRSAGITYVVQKKNEKQEIPISAAATKLVASTVVLGTNASAGREGPAILIGGALGYLFGKFLKNPSKQDYANTLILGSAAATSAIFQAPLGGTIFAQEVPYKNDIDLAVYMPSLLASIVSYLVYNVIFTFFRQDPRLLTFKVDFTFSLEVLLLVALLGLVCGVVGLVFTGIFNGVVKVSDNSLPIYLNPVVGITIASIIVLIASAFLSAPLSLSGSGFAELNYLESHPSTLILSTLFLLLVGKMVVTSVTVGSGVSGGVMGPSLVVGGATGSLIAILLGTPELIGAFIVIGMSACHTATTKTPIASVVLILEMASLPNLIIPMVIANFFAYTVSGNASLYQGQIHDRKERMLDEFLQKFKHKEYLEHATVKDIMIPAMCVVSVEEKNRLETVVQLMAKTRHNGFPVFNEDKELVGIITHDDIEVALNTKSAKDWVVGDVCTRNIVIVHPEHNLAHVLRLMGKNDINRLPVITMFGINTPDFTGWITRSDIMRAYFEEKSKLVHEEEEKMILSDYHMKPSEDK